MGLLHKGSRIANYVAVRKLGEGRFAEVWEMQDTAAGEDAPHVSVCVAAAACGVCVWVGVAAGGGAEAAALRARTL